jgi:uncharacterized protein YpbB
LRCILKELSDICSKRIAITDPEKIEEYQKNFLIAIGADLEPRKREKKVIELKKNTFEETKDLVLKKMPIKMISLERDISENTIYDHIDKLLEQKMLMPEDIEYLKPEKEKDKKILNKIIEAFAELETTKLKPVFEHFDEKYDYEVIRLGKLFANKG